MDLELEMEVTGGFGSVLSDSISIILGALTRLSLLGAGTPLPLGLILMDFSLHQGNYKQVNKALNSLIWGLNCWVLPSPEVIFPMRPFALTP